MSLAPTGPSYSCASWQEFIIGADGYANAWRGAQASCSSVAMGPPTDDLQRIDTVSRLTCVAFTLSGAGGRLTSSSSCRRPA